MRYVPLLLLAGCLAGEATDRWRYESVLWEREPAVRSAADADATVRELAARPEATLETCWRLAIRRAESLSLQGEELVRLQTRYEESVGAALPRLSLKGSWTRQDRVASETSFTLSERTEYKVFARQPVFAGLREFYAARQTSALYAAKEHDLRHARLALYRDVADAFYAVLELERDLATTRDSLRLAQERLQELVERNRAGISRRTEVLQQEAEAASTQAAADRLAGALAVARDALAFLTGLPAAAALADTPAPSEPAPVERYLERASAGRADLRSLHEQVRAAQEGVGAARSGWLPTIAIEGNWYAHREGVSEGIDWDVVLSGEIPLFDGFTTQAKLREAASSVRSARLRLSERERQIALSVSRAHVAARTAQNELSSLEKALASARENYELVQGEYRLGIVTNVEVLTSFDTMQRARLALDRARFQLRIALVALDVESGVEPGGAR